MKEKLAWIRPSRRTLRHLLLAALIFSAIPGTSDADATPIRLLGTFARTGPISVDPSARLLYQVIKGAQGPDTIEIRDLDSLSLKTALTFPLPQVGNLVTSFSAQHLGGRLTAIDTQHHRLFYVHRTDAANIEIVVIDGAHGHIERRYPLCAPDGTQAVCGPTAHYGVEALSYWPKDDLLYVLTITPIPVPSVSVVGHIVAQAVNATTGAVEWSSSVSGCESLFSDRTAMEPFGRSGNHLYLGCVAGNGGSNVSSPSGTAAVIRMTVSGAGAPTSVTSYASPFVPSRGLFDPTSERMFFLGGDLMAIFDGAHQVYVGLLATNYRPLMGINPTIGRLYLCATTGRDVLGEPIGGLLVTDAGVATPPPPGTEFPSISCYDGSTWPIEADPTTSRVFLPLDGDRWGVVEDMTPAYQVPPAFNPDEGAQDVPEVAGHTDSTFGGQAGAFGERVVMAGGPMGALDNVTPGLSLGQNLAKDTGIAFQPASRDIRFANVPLTKLGTDGAEAIAIAADRDARFDADLATLRQVRPEDRRSVAGETCGNPSTCVDTTTAPTWPYDPSHCFAFGGDTDKPSDDQPGSSARCNLKDSSAGGTAVAEKPLPAEVKADLAPLSGIVSVGESSAMTSVRRDPKLGMVAEASAIARHIVITGAAGNVFIAEADATATAHAAGHHHSANTTFLPQFHGVKVVGSSGAVVFQCEGSAIEKTLGRACIPSQVVDAMNQVLGPRITVRMPQPDPALLHGSPGGTAASVVQDFWSRTEEQALFDKPQDDLTTPAFEIRINTSVLKSTGYVVQFAGVSAVSTYRISMIPVLGAPVEVKPLRIIKIAPPTPTEFGVIVMTPHTTKTVILEKDRVGMRWMLALHARSVSLLAGWFVLLAPLFLSVRRRTFQRTTSHVEDTR